MESIVSMITKEKNKLDAIRDRMNSMVAGKEALIVADFHDQPYGKSKPNLKGEVRKITRLFFGFSFEIYVFLEGCRCSIPLKKVSILNPKVTK